VSIAEVEIVGVVVGMVVYTGVCAVFVVDVVESEHIGT
jgi:hypothetical protein